MKPAYFRDDRFARFVAWLQVRGAKTLPPTNPYEAIRFRSNHHNGVSIIYLSKAGKMTFEGVAEEAWRAFLGKDNKAEWNSDRFVPKIRSKTTRVLSALIRRDGPECWYCGRALNGKTATVEHICARSVGGPNHVANFCLACDPCNKEAENLPVVKKVELRERKRAKLGVTA